MSIVKSCFSYPRMFPLETYRRPGLTRRLLTKRFAITGHELPCVQ